MAILSLNSWHVFYSPSPLYTAQIFPHNRPWFKHWASQALWIQNKLRAHFGILLFTLVDSCIGYGHKEEGEKRNCLKLFFSWLFWVKVVVTVGESEQLVWAQVKMTCQRKWCDAWWWMGLPPHAAAISPPHFPHSTSTKPSLPFCGNEKETKKRKQIWTVATSLCALVWFVKSPWIRLEYCLQHTTSVGCCCYWNFVLD